MLLLAGTSDLIQVITGSASTVDVHASWVDNNAGTITPGRTNTAITTAATTTAVGSPAASTQRNVQTLNVRNKDAAVTNAVTIRHTDGTTIVELVKAVLGLGEELSFVAGHGWFVLDVAGSVKTAFSIPAGTVTNTALSNMAAGTTKGSVAGGVPSDLSKIQFLGMQNLITPTPESITLFGHSYMMDTICTYDQSSATAAIFRSALRCFAGNWNNYCNAGSKVTADSGNHIGGWVSVFSNMRIRGTNSTKKIAPYTGVGGLTVLGWGINDLGHYTDTTQELAAFISAMRCCISRVRAAIVMDNTDASVAYGAGFVSTTAMQDLSTMGTLRRATTTTAATATITIPADYNGEVIAVAFIGKAGVTGGVITFSGTAGWTGTISTSNIKASADATNCPVVRRGTAPITGATQTIICTVTTVDASGNVDFDSWWMESKYPSPVLVQNIARLTATGQSFWAEWSVGGSEAIRDASVVSWNAALVTLLAEFDSMVQIWDMDAALNKDVNNFSLVVPAQTHPNELGSALAADQGIVSLNKLVPVGGKGWSSCMYPGANSRSGIRVGFNSPNWYHTPFARISAALYTCVAGDMFAVPFQITDSITRFDTVGFECTNAPTTGTTVRIGIYYNNGEVPQKDYPGQLFHEVASGIAVGTTAALKTGAISEEMDPGLWWLVMLINVSPVTVPTLRQIDGPVPGMPSLASTGLPISGVLGPVGWKLTGQPNAALKTMFPVGAALVASAPFIGVRGAVPN
jgi:hypothetical protein